MYAKVKEYYIDLRKELPIFRSVFAVSLALIYATTMGYPIAHTTAIFAMMFIGPGKGPLKFMHILIYPIALYLIGFIAVYIGYVLIDHVFVTLLAIGLCIFWSFRATVIPTPVRILFLIFIVLIPLESITANALGETILVLLLLNLTIALIIVKFSFLLFPLSFSEQTKQKAKPQNASSGIQLNMNKVSVNGILVILPLLSYFYFTSDSDILILVFTALLAFDPFISQSKKGLFMLLANVWGGLIGILAYQLLVVAPSYIFYIFLCISICFYFIINIYSGKKTSPIYSTSFNTFFIVMGTIATSSNSASTKVWDRILQIGIALVYTIVAYKVVNLFNNPIKSKN